jgi:replicative DNA helicase/transposase
MTGQYPDKLLDRPLPSSEESERCILGGVLIDGRLLAQAKDVLSPNDFYSPLNRRIFDAMLGLDADGKPIEAPLLMEELKKSGPIEAIGGPSTLSNLAHGLPHFSDLSEYIKVVREKSLARRYIRGQEQVKARLLSEDESIADIFAFAKKQTAAFFDKAGSACTRPESVLRIKTANEWMQDAKERPIPKKLCGDLWFESEICILFGPTGRGKTALAVQIAESISSGRAIDESLELGVKGKRVLYLDCELSDKQFEGRYANKMADSDYYVSHYTFSENFFRAEIDLTASHLESETDFQERLQQSIGAAITEYQIDAIVIDNVTWLRDETEKARAALPLMKGLVELKARHGVSILVLAHTPKRDLTQPITLNHLQGSAVLSNFADSVFAISESVKDPGLRYLKQLKVRSAENVYGSENVKTCQLVKTDNFLRFVFGQESTESEHLKQLTEKDLDERRQSIGRLHSEGRSQRQIAQELGLSVSTVNKYVKQLDPECSPCSPVRGNERTNTISEQYEQGRTGANTYEQDRTNNHKSTENQENRVRSFVRPANGANV